MTIWMKLKYELNVVRHRGQAIRWFDGQDNWNPKTAKELGYVPYPAGWDKTVEAVIAHHASVHTAIGRAARFLYHKAAIRMAAHRDTGAARVGIEKGDYLDWWVYLEDRADIGSDDFDEYVATASNLRASALSIEFGHRTRNGGRVGGLFILTGAIDSMARVPNRRWDK